MKPDPRPRVAIHSGAFPRGELTEANDMNDFQRDPPTLLDLDSIPDPLAESTDEPLPSLRLAEPQAPSRAAVGKRRMAALGMSVAWVLGHLWVYGIRTDWELLPPAYVLAQIVLPLSLAAASFGLALSPGRFGLGRSVRWLLMLATIGPLSFWLAALAMPLPRVAESDPSFWVSTFVCLDLTLAWLAVPLAAAAFSLRHAFPTAATWKSALVGGACGLFCGSVMNLHCANVDPAHVSVAHGLPVLIASVLGALLLVRWTRS